MQRPFGRYDLHQLFLDFERRLALRQAGAVGNAKDMRVDRHGRLAEGDVEHDVRRLAPDAGQFLQRSAVMGHLAAMLGNQHLAQRDDVLGLGIEQADGAHMLDQAFEPERDHFLRPIDCGE
jgi:hypothetical protein